MKEEIKPKKMDSLKGRDSSNSTREEDMEDIVEDFRFSSEEDD